MAITLTEIEATISLRDQLTSQLDDVKRGLSTLGDHAETAGSKFSTFGSAASTALGTLTGILSAAGVQQIGGALADFAGEIIATAGELTDLNAKTGLSTDALQGLKFAAEQSGGSLTSVTNAVSMMSDKLGSGDKSAIAALGKLGLNFADIRAMKPEEAFYTITDALRGVGDRMTQTADAQDIFGKSGKELLKTVNDSAGGFRAMSDELTGLGGVISADTIAAVDDLSDRWDRLKTVLTGMVANELGPFVAALDAYVEAQERASKAAGEAKGATEDVSEATKTGAAFEREWGSALYGNEGRWQQAKDLAALYALALEDVSTAYQALQRDMGPATQAMHDYWAEVANGMRTAGTLDPRVAAAAPLAAKDALALLTEQTKDSKKAHEDATKAAEAHSTALGKLTGQDVIDRAMTLVGQITEIGGASQIADPQVAGVAKQLNAAIAIMEDRGEVVPEKLRAIAFEAGVAADAAHTGKLVAALSQLATMPAPNPEIQTALQSIRENLYNLPTSEYTTGVIQDAMAGIVDAARVGGQDVSKAVAEGIAKEQARVHQTLSNTFAGLADVTNAFVAGDWKSAVGTIGQMTMDLGRQMEGGLGQAIAGAGAGLQGFTDGWTVAEQTGSKALGSLSGAANGFASGFATGGPIGGAIGAFGGLLGGIFGPSQVEKVNDMRDAFVSQAGGITTLAEQAKAAGTNLNELLGAKKVDDFNDAVERLKQKFAEHKQELEEWGKKLNTVLGDGTLMTEELIKKTDDLMKRDPSGSQDTVWAFLQGEMATVAQGFDDAVEAWAAPFETLVEKAGDASLSAEDLIDVQQDLSDWAATNGDDFNRFGTLAVGVFEQLQQGGLSASDALAAMKPALDDLSDASKTLGWQGSETFDTMLRYASLADEFAPVLKQVDGLDAVLTGLYNTGLLTDGMFFDLAGQATSAFQQMVDGGASGEDAMRLMQPELQKIWQLQHDFGWEVDDATQALLDQAEASGVVGDQFRDSQDRMAKAVESLIARLDTLIGKLGGDLPGAADGAAGEVNSAFGRIDWEGLQKKSRETFDQIGQDAHDAAYTNSVIDVAFVIGDHVLPAMDDLSTTSTFVFGGVSSEADAAAKAVQTITDAANQAATATANIQPPAPFVGGATSGTLFTGPGFDAVSDVVMGGLSWADKLALDAKVKQELAAKAFKDWAGKQAQATKDIIASFDVPAEYKDVYDWMAASQQWYSDYFKQPFDQVQTLTQLTSVFGNEAGRAGITTKEEQKAQEKAAADAAKAAADAAKAQEKATADTTRAQDKAAADAARIATQHAQAVKQANDAYAHLVGDSLKGLDKQLYDIEQKRTKELASWAEVPAGLESMYDDARIRVNAKYDEMAQSARDAQVAVAKAASDAQTQALADAAEAQAKAAEDAAEAAAEAWAKHVAEIEQTWTDAVKHITSSGELISQQLLLVTRDAGFDQQSAAVQAGYQALYEASTQQVLGGFTQAGGAIESLLTRRTDESKKLEAAVAPLNKQLDDLAAQMRKDQAAVDSAVATNDELGAQLLALTPGTAKYAAVLEKVWTASDKVEQAQDALITTTSRWEAAGKAVWQTTAAMTPEIEKWDRFMRKAFFALGGLAPAAFARAQESGLGFLDAITAMQPALRTLTKVGDEFGLRASASFQQMLEWSQLADQNKAVFEFVQGMDDMLTGLGNSAAVTQDVFSEIASAITMAHDELQGFSREDSLRVMQPTLQKLWEMWHRWGFSVDDSTKAILDQAEAAGLIGEHWQSAEERIADAVEAMVDQLDTLIDRFDAVARVMGAFGTEVPGNLTSALAAANVPAMAEGGIVRSPTLALLGEGGPEAVLPLSGGRGITQTIVVQLDGQTLARAMVRGMPAQFEVYGIA